MKGEAARKLLDVLERASVDGAPHVEGKVPLPIALITVKKLEQGESVPSHVISDVISNGFTKNLASEFQQQYVQYLGRTLDPNPVPKDRTVKGQMEGGFVYSTLAMSLGRSAGRFDAYQRNIGVFVEWAGPTSEISTIDAPKIRDFYDWLCQQVGVNRFSPSYARSLLNAAKNFVSRVAELGLMPLPGNLRSKDFTFDDSAGVIEYLSVPEIRSLLAECDRVSARTKLFLLLMLNCGMYQSDISDMKPSELDLERGVITRRRSKRRKGGLLVTYKLWPETLELLRLLGATEGIHVLSSEDGNPLVSYKTVNAKLRRYDLVGHAYEIVRKRAGVNKPIKAFRKTAAHILDSHRMYRTFCPYFLAHARRTVTEISYVGAPPKSFSLRQLTGSGRPY